MAPLGFDGLGEEIRRIDVPIDPKPNAGEVRHSIATAIAEAAWLIRETGSSPNALTFSKAGYRRYRVLSRMGPIRARYSWRQLLWHDTHRLPLRQRWTRRITQAWRHYQLPMIHVDRDQGGYMTDYPEHTDVISIFTPWFLAEIDHFRGNQPPFLRKPYSWWTCNGEYGWKRNLRVGRWEVRW